jgi:hypothetical protein
MKCKTQNTKQNHVNRKYIFKQITFCYQNDDNGSSKHLWNVSQFLRDHTAQHSRSQTILINMPTEVFWKFWGIYFVIFELIFHR